MTALERARGWFIAPPEATGDDEPVWCALSPPPTVSPESASEEPASPARAPRGAVTSERAVEGSVSLDRAARGTASSERAVESLSRRSARRRRGVRQLTRVFRGLAGAPLLPSRPASAGVRGRPVTSRLRRAASCPTTADRCRPPMGRRAARAPRRPSCAADRSRAGRGGRDVAPRGPTDAACRCAADRGGRHVAPRGPTDTASRCAADRGLRRCRSRRQAVAAR